MLAEVKSKGTGAARLRNSAVRRKQRDDAGSVSWINAKEEKSATAWQMESSGGCLAWRGGAALCLEKIGSTAWAEMGSQGHRDRRRRERRLGFVEFTTM